MKNQPLVCLAFIIASGIASADQHLPAPSPTPRKPVTDEVHGVRITDDYRWLENGGDPAVREWSRAQNRVTRAYLDSLPGLDAIRTRLTQLVGARSPNYAVGVFRGGKLFVRKSQPPKQQPFLITLESADAPETEHIVLDPNKLDSNGRTAIDFYVPSLDGRLVAVSLSQNGSEDGTLHVVETDTGKQLADEIPRVQYPTGGGSVAWNADGSGFYYTRYPHENERPREDLNFYQQVYFHKLGTPTAEDTYVIGKDFPRIAETVLTTTDDGRYLLATVANGDGGEFAHYLREPSGKWITLTHFRDQITGAAFGPDDALYLLSLHGSPRGKILRLPLADPSLDRAKVVVPESEVAIEGIRYTGNAYATGFVPTATRLYLVDSVGGPSQIRVFDHQGGEVHTLPIPPITSVSAVVPLHGDEILFEAESYLSPSAWYHFDPASGKVARTGLFQKSPADFSDCEVVREFATSKDGTRVPMSIVRRKGTLLNGKNSTLLTGYGGFGINQTPAFRPDLRVWLEQGGVFVSANLRGGREYGDEWHRAGNLVKKQNVFDDFAACARRLVELGYTSSAKLAIEGGSNGGLLMGAVLTQHPDLCRAVASHVGLYDMVRFENHPNGVFIAAEYGSVKNAEQFRALYAYSPYHHVKDGTAYPALLLLTGENDGRVDPAHSRKMTARLQAATSSGRPILLRTNFAAGHGIGSALNDRIAERADVYAFLFHELGVTYRPAH